MSQFDGLRRSFPTFYQFLRPVRHLARPRRLWPLVLTFLAPVPAAWLWWAVQLWDLPNIGDPFDVEAFRAETIPDDRNAFVLYRQAAARYSPLKPSDTSLGLGGPAGADTQWSKPSPEVRTWAEANRAALALYRQGADRPDALDPTINSVEEFESFGALQPLQRLALLEASRLEGQGDMGGAWGWYRAYLRTIHHAGTRGRVYRRGLAQHWHDELRRRLEAWAADPRTTPADLRRALADAQACEAIVPSDAYTLKAEFLHADHMFDRYSYLPSGAPPAWLVRFGSWRGSRWLALFIEPEHLRAVSHAWSVWRGEPERSQRVFRLLTANRLAYYDLPPDRRPAPDPGYLTCPIYRFGDEAPAKARILSPESLGAWLDSTLDPRGLLNLLEARSIRFREVANHRALVIQLASQLYRRDHGEVPSKPEALVGPYLERLPPEFPDEGTSEMKSEMASPDD